MSALAELFAVLAEVLGRVGPRLAFWRSGNPGAEGMGHLGAPRPAPDGAEHVGEAGGEPQR